MTYRVLAVCLDLCMKDDIRQRRNQGTHSENGKGYQRSGINDATIFIAREFLDLLEIIITFDVVVGGRQAVA